MVLTPALLIVASILGGASLIGAVKVVDGDSLYVDGVHIRLQGLDAPEMPTHQGKAAKAAMQNLVKGQNVRCELTGDTSYDRKIATCYVGNVDLTDAMIRLGMGRPYCRFVGERYNDAAKEGGVRDCTRNHPTRPPR